MEGRHSILSFYLFGLWGKQIVSTYFALLMPGFSVLGINRQIVLYRSSGVEPYHFSQNSVAYFPQEQRFSARPLPLWLRLVSGKTQIGLTPTQLALAWVYSREFVTSTVIGATSTLQLRDNLRSLNCPVTEKADEQIQVLYDKCVFVIHIALYLVLL